MKAQVAGEEIFDYFSSLPIGRSVTRQNACQRMGLSSSQWTRGREYLRNLFGQDPIIHIRSNREIVYFLASYGTERDAREYWSRKLRGDITAAEREHNEAHGINAAFPTAENAQQVAFARLRLTNLRTAHRQLMNGGQEELGID